MSPLITQRNDPTNAYLRSWLADKPPRIRRLCHRLNQGVLKAIASKFVWLLRRDLNHRYLARELRSVSCQTHGFVDLIVAVVTQHFRLLMCQFARRAPVELGALLSA